MEYGASKSQNREKNRQALLDFCMDFNNILDFTTEDTEAYGLIRAYLEKEGKVIGPYDMQIAAQAMTRNLTVITNNYDKFVRTPVLPPDGFPKTRSSEARIMNTAIIFFFCIYSAPS